MNSFLEVPKKLTCSSFKTGQASFILYCSNEVIPSKRKFTSFCNEDLDICVYKLMHSMRAKQK